MKTSVRRARDASEGGGGTAMRARRGGAPATDARRNGRRARRRRRGRRTVAALAALVLVTIAAVFWAVSRPGTTSGAGAGPVLVKTADPSSSTRWHVAFDDEFDGARLATRRWATCYWWATTGCTNLGNHELEWYQPENVQVGGGALRLEARRARVTGDGKPFSYTSGMVATIGHTDDRFSFRYGFVETRARVPRGTGFWPAFWMLPTSRDSKPEVDVFEMLGDQPRTMSMHVHWRGPGGNELADGVEWSGPDFTAGWHTFGLDWEPDHLTWYVDGVPRWQVTDPARIPHEPMYLIANLAVGGDNTVPPTASTPFPSTFALDYVRVWHR
jgi:beta-glucanase (GH16 family)